ncbi:MAG: hypothetical protein LBQ22_04490 [Bacteroidales bacterium]|jgi:opacity protein-like surface antigen|nr:hypothetical protein [Bacteroidales bacterium]
MKAIIIFVLFMFVSAFVYSQDKIVTQSGDTINCKITNILDGYIYYTVTENKENRRSIIPMGDVQYYVSASDKGHTSARKPRTDFDTAKLQLGLNFGMAYRIAKINDQIDESMHDYYNKLRLNFYFSGDLAYYLNAFNGIGIKYSRLSASNDQGGVEIVDTSGNSNYGKMSDKVVITYMGLFYSLRFINERHSLYVNPGIGKFTYSDSFNFTNIETGYVENNVISGSALGFTLDLGYDYRITNFLSAGAKLSYYHGKIRNQKYSNSSAFINSVQPAEGIQNFNISLGIKLLLGW